MRDITEQLSDGIRVLLRKTKRDHLVASLQVCDIVIEAPIATKNRFYRVLNNVNLKCSKTVRYWLSRLIPLFAPSLN